MTDPTQNGLSMKNFPIEKTLNRAGDLRKLHFLILLVSYFTATEPSEKDTEDFWSPGVSVGDISTCRATGTNFGTIYCKSRNLVHCMR